MTFFLFRYESTSGLWVETKLASPVSSAIWEAMNVILSRDGILAYIGTRSEFGQYKTELDDRREADSTGYWTSLPEHTILATLGLCLNTSTAEGRSLVFHGSPRTLMLGYMIDIIRVEGLEETLLDTITKCIENGRPFHLDNHMIEQVHPVGINLYPNELQDSLADFIGVLGERKFSKYTYRFSQKV